MMLADTSQNTYKQETPLKIPLAPNNLKIMDLRSPKYLQSPSIFASNGEPPMETNTSFYGKSKDNPFADTFPDPLCKLNLKETSEFVKSFPMAAANNESRGGFIDVSLQRRREGVNSVTQRRVEAPCTPGRPVFSFSVGNLSRKSFPSKWDDAEKWLISTSCNESPAHAIKSPESSSKFHKQCDVNYRQQMEVVAEKSRVTEEKVSKVVSSFQGSVSLDHHSHNSARAFNGVSGSTDVPLKGGSIFISTLMEP